jgi:hypothetical protein
MSSRQSAAESAKRDSVHERPFSHAEIEARNLSLAQTTNLGWLLADTSSGSDDVYRRAIGRLRVVSPYSTLHGGPRPRNRQDAADRVAQV